MWFLVLSACPAEQLGVELPPPGAGSISPEDVRRDAMALAAPGWEGFLVRRFDAMRLDAAEGGGSSICGKRGRGEPARVFVAPFPGAVEETAALAALISLAKAADTSERIDGTYWFCAGTPSVEGRRVTLRHLASGELVLGETVSAGEVVEGRPLAELDYRDVAAHAGVIWETYGD